MPSFRVLPVDRSFPSVDFTAKDGREIFSLVDRLACREADVLVDGSYSFSVRMNNSGMWSIFQRDFDTTAIGNLAARVSDEASTASA
jgi:hypothetical protein